jgi:peptidoglycan/xylan/chitin deacetylase (PgdA/CDA1 family)
MKLPRKCDSIAITFDDGPHTRNTQKILGLLQDYHAKATFFTTGANLRARRSLAEEMVRDGHTVANHTYHHCNALCTGYKTLYDEIVRTRDLIEDITGKKNFFFRPPYGMVTPSLLSLCHALSLSIVLWNANTADYRRHSPEIMVKRVEKKIKPGTILLFHEGHYSNQQLDYSNTILALDKILQKIAQKKMSTVSLDEVL